MIINAIREYFKSCPLLKDGYIGVDFLADGAGEYVIEPLPCDPIIKKYVGGDSRRRYDFVFASRQGYSEEVRRNIENSGLFENIAGWIEESSEKGSLPQLGSGRTAYKLAVVSSGFLYSDDGNDTAVYQMQVRLEYYQLN